MKRYRVYGIDIVVDAMTLKGEVASRVLLFDVLNGTAAFDGADGKAIFSSKIPNRPNLHLERGHERLRIHAD